MEPALTCQRPTLCFAAAIESDAAVSLEGPPTLTLLGGLLSCSAIRPPDLTPQQSPYSGHPTLSTLLGDPERSTRRLGAWASPPRPCSGSPSLASHPELSLCCRWVPEGHTVRPGHALGERASPLADRAQTDDGQLHCRAHSQFSRLQLRICTAV
ncbi:hypothetical protein PAL_GLEAN10022990 [Pteropus alecto]|uniref:Uncharacterized protein n=1 Tax=Pteropus alecto TaxID=9402 RepID=L5K4G7_PTEAL|nr:hypothetical protein PAL_GLEAN10022990 [Pteropus alecto]